ncbi:MULTISPECIES: NUDIX hydrolase [Vibrio]|jgi:ADP-ribose pyrophosphatase|uniref:GDP-mannose pyrophosphatase n=1 Tax=Vibrio mediterranei TaxID=689 RepID=A0A241TBU8_9VIBR|nr:MULTISPECIES: NUDIX hydrolase [Vibrio]ASI92710.1 ADP-ribose pyrophosphatase [Vibrio mediterranei]AYV24741.1 NUDIX hydrolase [Vibrio mediterranei]KFA97957.1 ADP-ribose pyrophosphatase [Vibrio sp. ER1A]
MAQRTIHQWKSIALVEEDIELPNQKNITHTTIKHPGAAVILPVTESGDILLLNQYRPSLKKWLLELPAGTMELGENAENCAHRELIEETGFEAGSMISLGQVTPLAGFCDEIQHLYIAKSLKPNRSLECDDDEVIELVTMSLTELQQKIIDGGITDAKTIACLSKATLCGYI